MDSPEISSFHADWPAQEERTAKYVSWVAGHVHRTVPVQDHSDPKQEKKPSRKELLDSI